MIEQGRVYTSDEAQREVDSAIAEREKELIKQYEFQKGYREAVKTVCEIFARRD